MKKENLAIGIAVAGVIVAMLNWLMPFTPYRTSPAEAMFGQPVPATVTHSGVPQTASTSATGTTATFAAETLTDAVVTSPPATVPATSQATEAEPRPVQAAETVPIDQASMLRWGGTPVDTTTLPAITDDRVRWTHSAGSFIDITGGRWLEKRADGAVAFRFREHSRTTEAIELHDPSRDCYVRLTAGNCYVKCMWWPEEQRRWDLNYYGGWR